MSSRRVVRPAACGLTRRPVFPSARTHQGLDRLVGRPGRPSLTYPADRHGRIGSEAAAPACGSSSRLAPAGLPVVHARPTVFMGPRGLGPGRRRGRRTAPAHGGHQPAVGRCRAQWSKGAWPGLSPVRRVSLRPLGTRLGLRGVSHPNLRANQQVPALTDAVPLLHGLLDEMVGLLPDASPPHRRTVRSGRERAPGRRGPLLQPVVGLAESTHVAAGAVRGGRRGSGPAGTGRAARDQRRSHGPGRPARHHRRRRAGGAAARRDDGGRGPWTATRRSGSAAGR